MGAVGDAVSDLQGAYDSIGGAGNDAVPTCGRTTLAVAAHAKGIHDDAKTTAGHYRGALSADTNAIASLGRALRAEDQALAGNG